MFSRIPAIIATALLLISCGEETGQEKLAKEECKSACASVAQACTVACFDRLPYDRTQHEEKLCLKACGNTFDQRTQCYQRCE